MKRRHFIGTAFAGLAAAQTVPRAAAANEKVNVAVIGVGGRGRGLMRNFASLPDVNVSHLCDVDQASLERADAAWTQAGFSGSPKHVGDLRQVLEDPQVDAVAIATPDHWHAPAAILACEAGKDVYVEKPCSHNIREGRLIVEAARRNKRIVQHGTQARSSELIKQAVEAVRNGEIGRVLMAKAWDIQLRDDIGHKPDGPVPEGVDYDAWLGPAPWIPFNENRFHYKWHWHWHFGTGDAGNDGIHQLDMARWVLGASCPRKISGMGRKIFFDDDQQTPDTMNITFDYGDKALIWEMRIWNPYGMDSIGNGVAVYGSEGMLRIGRSRYTIFDRDGKAVREEQSSRRRGRLDAHARNFIDCVKSRKLPNADIGIAHLSAMHSHLANIVARVGRNIDFDPETETVIGDEAANLYVSRRYRAHWATPKRL